MADSVLEERLAKMGLRCRNRKAVSKALLDQVAKIEKPGMVFGFGTRAGLDEYNAFLAPTELRF